MNLDLRKAVHYHLDRFPPAELEHYPLLPGLLSATDALARYDQALQGMHDSEVFLAPLRGQEAVVSSRMEGTISTMDEILQLEVEYDEDNERAIEGFRSDVIETALYHRALSTAQRQLEEGRPLSESLIKSIHQRQQTIQSIAAEIVSRQEGFLEHGPSRLKPMNMAQIAEKVGVHETTVSRAVSGKYMATPHGVFEMKYFFTTGYETEDGESLSNTSVKQTLAEMIGAENPRSGPYRSIRPWMAGPVLVT